MFWFIVGFFVGLFLPAPYSSLVREWVSNVWSKITGK